jgi:hypothetical protein
MRSRKRDEAATRSFDATVARVNYRTGELWVVTDDGLRELILSDRCRIRFNGRPAPFRSFQPLDRVRVRYADYEFCLVAKAVDLWAEEPKASRYQRR